MSKLNHIQIERRLNNIAIITINRPEVLNAINVEVIAELSQAIDILSADDSVKVVIITGKGERSFCAGADIRYVININAIEAERYASSVHDMLNKIENYRNLPEFRYNKLWYEGISYHFTSSASDFHHLEQY